MQNSHKFVHRTTGKVVYLGEEGKRQLERTSKLADLKYIGIISTEDKAKEIANAVKPIPLSESTKENKTLVEKAKAKVKELSQEEINALNEKSTIIEDENEELTPAQLKKLENDKKKLAEKNGKEA